MQSRNGKRTAAEAELEEEELENEEQPNKSAYRWRNAPQSMYNVFNAIQTGEVQHTTYQPEWLLPEIQMMVSEYLGGTCDNITQSAHHCWTQHRLLDETEQLVHNCTEYCFAHTDDWLLPILLSFPTYGVINSRPFQLNLTRLYYIEMNDIYHISVGAINIGVFQYFDMARILHNPQRSLDTPMKHSNVKKTIQEFPPQLYRTTIMKVESLAALSARDQIQDCTQNGYSNRR